MSQQHSLALCSDYQNTANVNILGNILSGRKKCDAVMPKRITGFYGFFDNRVSLLPNLVKNFRL